MTTASYGGKKILLVRSKAAAEERFTVLTVLEGFEKSMLDSYLKAHAPGGSSIGEFAKQGCRVCKGQGALPECGGGSLWRGCKRRLDGDRLSLVRRPRRTEGAAPVI